MWHNPRLLNAVAGFLTAIGLMAFVAAGAHLLLRSPLFPLREVAVSGTLAHTTREEIERAMQSRISGNFFAADLGTMRAELERLAWVRRVDVRRAWPDRIEVALEEHVALARWGNAGLVNTRGERFDAVIKAELPQFSGPDGTEKEVTLRYRRFIDIVAPLGADLERVTLTPRRSWQLRLASGLQLELGRDLPQAGTPEARLSRFVAAYPLTLARIARVHENVDLRSPNGFALRVPEFKG